MSGTIGPLPLRARLIALASSSLAFYFIFRFIFHFLSLFMSFFVVSTFQHFVVPIITIGDRRQLALQRFDGIRLPVPLSAQGLESFFFQFPRLLLCVFYLFFFTSPTLSRCLLSTLAPFPCRKVLLQHEWPHPGVILAPPSRRSRSTSRVGHIITRYPRLSSKCLSFLPFYHRGVWGMPKIPNSGGE